MPRIFNENEMQTVFTAIQGGSRIKEIAMLMNITPERVNQLHQAAVRRTWPHYQRRMQQAKRKNYSCNHLGNGGKTSTIRPVAIYSNSGNWQYQSQPNQAA